jgi:serine/threonine protein kinase
MEMDVGERIDRYRIVGPIDEDATSARFDARDGDVPVVVRVFRPWVGLDDEASGRLQRVAAIVTAAAHPNLVAPLATGVSNGLRYVATRPYAGEPLLDLLGRPLASALVADVLMQLCRALQVLHAAGVVCRRLPADVYVSVDGLVAVDVLATVFPRSHAAGDPALESKGVGIDRMADLTYFSPEQLMGKLLDGRSDIYTLGVIGYQLITGRLPFPDAKGPAGLITAQLKQTALPPSQFMFGVPEHVDGAIRWCLEKDKTKRPDDVNALAAVLEERAPCPPRTELPPTL